MATANVPGYPLPVFPLDIHRLIENNKDTINLKRTMADYDDGTPLSLITGTKESRMLEYSIYVNNGEKLNLERFFTRELYYNVKQQNGESFVYVDPTQGYFPNNSAALKERDNAILRRGISQGTNIFQMYDIRDGIFKKYKLYSDPQFNWEYFRYKATFQLVELGLSDCLLKIEVTGDSGLPQGLIYVNAGGLDPNQREVELYYDNDLFQTIPVSPGVTVTMALKPSAYYTIKYQGVLYKLPTIALENDELEVEFEGIGIFAKEIKVIDFYGDFITGGKWWGSFTDTGYDFNFNNVDYADFGLYFNEVPFTVGTTKYNMQHTFDAQESGVYTFALPTIAPVFKEPNGTIVTEDIPIDIEGWSSTYGHITYNVAPVGVCVFQPAKYNLYTQQFTMQVGGFQDIEWVIATLDTSFAGVDGGVISTEVKYNDEAPVFTSSPHHKRIGAGTHTVSLPKYNLSKTVILAQQQAGTVSFVIPKVLVTWKNSFNEDVETYIYLNGVSTGVNTSPYTDYVAAGATTLSLPDYNLTYSVTISEGSLITKNFTIPAGDITCMLPSGTEVPAEGTYLKLNGVIVATISPVVPGIHINVPVGDTHLYECCVDTDFGEKVCLSSTYTYTETNNKYIRKFLPPMVQIYKTKGEALEFANADGTLVRIEMGNADGTKTPLYEYTLVNLEGSAYEVSVNDDIWYKSDSAPFMPYLLCFLSPTDVGKTATATIDGYSQTFTLNEGDYKIIRIDIV